MQLRNRTGLATKPWPVLFDHYKPMFFCSKGTKVKLSCIQHSSLLRILFVRVWMRNLEMSVWISIGSNHLTRPVMRLASWKNAITTFDETVHWTINRRWILQKKKRELWLESHCGCGVNLGERSAPYQWLPYSSAIPLKSPGASQFLNRVIEWQPSEMSNHVSRSGSIGLRVHVILLNIRVDCSSAKPLTKISRRQYRGNSNWVSERYNHPFRWDPHHRQCGLIQYNL